MEKITQEEVNEAQRSAPGAPETRALCSAFGEQQFEIEEAERLKLEEEEEAEQEAADRALERRLAVSEYSETTWVQHPDSHSDFADRLNRSEGDARKWVYIRAAKPHVYWGHVSWHAYGPIYRCKVLASSSTHWSDQPRGESGWWFRHEIELPEVLRTSPVICIGDYPYDSC